ncbi:MAG: hypothetical protein R3C68_12970 [Myxococcota bacterium]
MHKHAKKGDTVEVIGEVNMEGGTDPEVLVGKDRVQLGGLPR